MGIKESYSKKIVKACSIVAKHILDDRGEPPLWPMNIAKTLWYLSKFFPKEVYITIEKLRKRGVSEKEISDLFLTPTRLTYVYNQAEFPIEGLTAEEGENLFETFMDYIAFYRKEDIYCDKLRNILWDKEQVMEALNKYEFISPRKYADWQSLSQLLGKFNSVMWLYTEFINAAKHPYSHEFHGPYTLPHNETLIVRKYYDLKPTEIWPFLIDVSYDTILTLEIYKDADLGFDFLNHSASSVSHPKCLQSFFVGVGTDETPMLDPKDLRTLLTEYQNIIMKGNKAVSAYTDADWLVKLLELHFYYLKPHKDRLRENWRPPKVLYEFVKIVEPDEKLADFMDLVGRAMRTPTEQFVSELTNLHVQNIYSGPESKYLKY